MEEPTSSTEDVNQLANEGESSSTTSSNTKQMSGADKHKERLDKLKALKMRRFESKKLNRAEVVEEDRKGKLPKNWENRQQRAEYKLNEIEQRKTCDENGIDYDREKLLHVSASEAERLDGIKRRKKDPDLGFSTFEAAGARNYQKITKQIQPDMEDYNRRKDEMGEELFYAGLNTLLPGKIKDTKQGIDKMVNDLLDRKAKKKPFSRRRVYDESKDVDYINESNARHNKRLERFYGKYTAEIKQNLERGTAV
ncbi:pre-mRNA-splicing factor syf2-like [Clavelina lepadiformis]|uniref:Pre-mRNA-splicing factor SYF2 n=1 Tax=Clavelina lepadiformis TaxID=159417 RepID=A0ABP0GXB4_CLALP